MAEPVLFISHARIKADRREDALQLARAATERLRLDKPRTLVFLVYLDAEHMSLSFVHVFGDAHAMDVHVEGAAERGRAAAEFIELTGWEVYGTPSVKARQALEAAAQAAGAPITFEPEFVAGFLRLADASAT